MKLQFRLSSLLMLTILAALLLAWRLDHQSKDRALFAAEAQAAMLRIELSLERAGRLEREELWRDTLDQYQKNNIADVERAYTLGRELFWKSNEVRNLLDVNQRFRSVAQDQRIQQILRENVTREYADLASVAEFLEWSPEEEVAFLMEPPYEQRFLVESARELQKGAPFKQAQIDCWKRKPLLAKGLKKANS